MADNARDVSPVEAREEQEKLNGDDSSSKGDTNEDRQGSMAISMGQHEQKKAELGNDDKIEITEEDCMDELGFSFPSWKKWYILTVIFIVQVGFPCHRLTPVCQLTLAGFYELQHQLVLQRSEGYQ